MVAGLSGSWQTACTWNLGYVSFEINQK